LVVASSDRWYAHFHQEEQEDNTNAAIVEYLGMRRVYGLNPHNKIWVEPMPLENAVLKFTVQRFYAAPRDKAPAERNGAQSASRILANVLEKQSEVLGALERIVRFPDLPSSEALAEIESSCERLMVSFVKPLEQWPERCAEYDVLAENHDKIVQRLATLRPFASLAQTSCENVERLVELIPLVETRPDFVDRVLEQLHGKKSKSGSDEPDHCKESKETKESSKEWDIVETNLDANLM
jgi:hypothetical protein